MAVFVPNIGLPCRKIEVFLIRAYVLTYIQLKEISRGCHRRDYTFVHAGISLVCNVFFRKVFSESGLTNVTF